MHTKSQGGSRPPLITCAVVLLGVAIAFAAPHPHARARQTDRPPYQVDGKVTEPRLFGEGIISTVDDEIGGTFSADGREFYFSRVVPYTTLPRLAVMCVSTYRDGNWSTPEVLPFSGKYLDNPPRLDPNGQRLLFASSRPLPDGARGHLRIWEVTRTTSGWAEPKPLPPPVNAPENFWNADPSISSDGTLYFSSDRSGPGTLHIYRSRIVDGKYSEPEKLGPEINSDFYDFQPFISPDGKILIFASAGEGSPPFRHRPGAMGGGGKLYPHADLYVSVNREGKWSSARHLEHGINSFAEEEFPFLTPDGKYLFFSSERSRFIVPTAHRLDYDELESHLHSIMNSRGNVFFIDADALEVGK